MNALLFQLNDRDAVAAFGAFAGGLRFRACRVIVDARLQRGEFDFGDAVRFLRENAASDSASAAGEVKRYCHTPTQAMAYLVGKEQLTALREEYRRAHTADFTLGRFHDALLAVGSIPPPLARKLVLGLPVFDAGR